MDEMPPPKLEVTDVLQMLEAATRARVQRFLRMAQERGFHLKVTEGFRTWERQEELYAQGRTKRGKVVTWARGGHSWHNYGRAIDVAFIENGKLTWEGNWNELGPIGEAAGLEWGGRWKGKKCDTDHFQFTNGMTIQQAMELRAKQDDYEEDWQARTQPQSKSGN